MSTDLDSFVRAQDEHDTYRHALAEVRSGRKGGHWMWFVLPQLEGLGRSATARRYGVRDLAQARAYLAHPVLGERLREVAAALLEQPVPDAVEVFGEVDAAKLRSSMTLFGRAAPDDPLFPAVLDRFFADGRPGPAAEDPVTAAMLREDPDAATMRLFHLVDPAVWAAAGALYAPPSLAGEGFVHCSFAEQVAASADRHYAGAPALAVVELEPARLGAPVVVEDTAGRGERFPHVYGPVPVAAAVSRRVLQRGVDGRWLPPER